MDNDQRYWLRLVTVIGVLLIILSAVLCSWSIRRDKDRLNYCQSIIEAGRTSYPICGQ